MYPFWIKDATKLEEQSRGKSIMHLPKTYEVQSNQALKTLLFRYCFPR